MTNSLTKIITPVVQSILDVHDSLWDKVSNLDYKDKQYITRIDPNGGFVSVILPNSDGKNYLWITQNLNKESYASIEIKQARIQGDDKKVTWIVDNNNNKFEYCGLVKTCLHFDGQKDILIEKYNGNITEVVYTTDPHYEAYVVHKSKY